MDKTLAIALVLAVLSVGIAVTEFTAVFARANQHTRIPTTIDGVAHFILFIAVIVLILIAAID